MAYYTSEGVYDKISSYYEELKAETEKNYTIEYIAGTFQYHYVIKANDGTILFDETSSRGFHIEAVDKDLIFLWQQAGTGTLTRGGQFYNLETKEISEHFQGMVDYCNGVVSNTGSGQVTLTLLKDPSQVLIIDEFKYPVSSFIENIANAKFVNDGKQIKITYWTGENENQKQATELFDVTLNTEA